MPTSTNLSLVTPDSTAYVTAGATAMTTLANGIDAYWGALTTYTPTLTNVTGGTASGRYVRMGKLGYVFGWVSAGTATAAGTITVSLPTGWTAVSVAVSQTIPAINGNAIVSATVASAATAVTVRADAAGANFALGASVASVRFNGWVVLT